MHLLNSLARILLSQLFRMPFVFRTALLLYEYRKKTHIGLPKNAWWLRNLFNNPFDTFQEIREFTGKICTMRNGLYLINRSYVQEEMILPFLVRFKRYEKGKVLKKYFISKQYTSKPLSEEDERLFFSFLSDCHNYTLSNMPVGLIQMKVL